MYFKGLLILFCLILCSSKYGRAQFSSVSVSFFDLGYFKNQNNQLNPNTRTKNINRNLTPFLEASFLHKSKKSSLNLGIGFSKPLYLTSSNVNFLNEFSMLNSIQTSNQLFSKIGLSKKLNDGEKIIFRLEVFLPITVIFNQLRVDSNLRKNLSTNEIIYFKTTSYRYPVNFITGIYIMPSLTYKIKRKFGIKIEQSFGIYYAIKRGKTNFETNEFTNNISTSTKGVQNEFYNYLNYKNFFILGFEYYFMNNKEKPISN